MKTAPSAIRAGASVIGQVTLGDEARALGDAARAAGLDDVIHVESRDAALGVLRARLGAGDVVLIKGSHAVGLEALVADLAEGGAS